MSELKPPDVKNIIKLYIINNGYDGLVNLEGECGCTIDDYHACGEYMFECRPAYKWRNACKECEHHCDGYDESGKNYCMRLEKQPKEDTEDCCPDCKSSDMSNYCDCCNSWF